MKAPDLLASRHGRLTAFFFLYVTEGIPLGFGAVAIAYYLRTQGVGPAEIGAFVGSFYLPWAFKWAFGPFIDVFASKRLGKRRGWIIGTQIGLIVTLLCCMGIELPSKLGLLTSVLLIHNTFAAMQDVAIDALAVSVLAEDERGLANGVMFAGAAIGQAVGGSGMLVLMPRIGISGGFAFVAILVALVTIFVALPLKERIDPAAPAAPRGLAAAAREIRRFSVEAFRSFTGTRGAYAGLFVALLPAGAMSLGLALQSNLSVEVGMGEDQVASLGIWSQVTSAAFMIIGGRLSDRFGRRRTLILYLLLMSPPVLYLMWVLQSNGWITSQTGRVAPAAVVTAVWVATLTYAVGQGLMYGTRSAIFMDVTNPRVAATQFTAYMAMANLAIAYSSVWQGIAIEAVGYPKTLLIDAITGPLAVLLVPLMVTSATPEGDGRGSVRTRVLAAALAIGCLAFLPYRAGLFDAGAIAPIWETFFTLIFVASAVFLAAGSGVLGLRGNPLAKAGLVVAPFLLAMEARSWPEYDDVVPGLAAAYYLVPVLGAMVLGLQALLRWRALDVVVPAGAGDALGVAPPLEVQPT